jgi:threonine aldolase
MQSKFHFASDNTSGFCPEAWQALQAANEGYCASYGDDAFTREAADALRAIFEVDCDIYFVFNGTAANSLALAALCQSYHSVIVHEHAHVEKDECGAPEFFSNGTKILLAHDDGKIRPETVKRLVTSRRDIHYPKPQVLSLSQPTELGLVYRPEEISSLAETARRHGLKLHVDGARFANAVASLGVAPKAISWEAGVDVLCFGGSKAGMGFAEAVIFFDRELSKEFAWRCKQAGQLASKMRFLAAPWVPLLRDGGWLRYARHANECARELAEGLVGLPGVRLLRPVEANAVFVEMPSSAANRLRDKGWEFYTFIGGGARFMCSWKTKSEDVAALLRAVAAALNETTRD